MKGKLEKLANQQRSRFVMKLHLEINKDLLPKRNFEIHNIERY